jgi:hypothetical protein
MGMFDEMRVRYPLPNLPAWADADGWWQTKDLECQMHYYVLLANGELHRSTWDAERREFDIEPDVEDYTGGLNFYTGHVNGKFDGHWIEYIALIHHGRVLMVEQVECTEPDTGERGGVEPDTEGR